jgi:benzoate membrane transport protein
LFSGVLLALSLEPVDLSGIHFALAEPEWIAPAWSLSSIINLALPLVLVSLSGQFLPGMAILQNAEHSVKAKPIITATSLASIPFAFSRAITTVVAVITAAICTGADAHHDTQKRYVSGVFNGVFYLVGALFAGTIVALFSALPSAFIAVLAGLALLAPIQNNLSAAMDDAQSREAALIIFIVTASGLQVWGLSSAF